MWAVFIKCNKMAQNIFLFGKEDLMPFTVFILLKIFIAQQLQLSFLQIFFNVVTSVTVLQSSPIANSLRSCISYTRARISGVNVL